MHTTSDPRIGLGLDAPIGKGNDGNRERISLEADAQGGGFVRLLGRDTWTKAIPHLDAAEGSRDNMAYLDFIDVPPGRFVRRRLSVKGDTTLVRPR